MSTSTERSRVWFITGASRGLGRALAQAVLDHGEQLAATARDSAALADLARRYPDLAIALDLDVTDRSQVTDGVGRAIREFGRIDVLVNNAGYGLLGALEELPDSELRGQFETNLFGVLEVTRAVLPHFRQQRSGHIVQISSLSGVAPNPGESAYAASKAAVEAASEALAQEVAHLGIRVMIVEPGPVRTEFAGRSLKRAAPIDDYDQSVGQVREVLGKLDGAQPNDPALAAEAIIQAVGTKNPPLRLALGEEAYAGIRQHLQERAADLARTERAGTAIAYAAG